MCVCVCVYLSLFAMLCYAQRQGDSYKYHTNILIYVQDFFFLHFRATFQHLLDLLVAVILHNNLEKYRYYIHNYHTIVITHDAIVSFRVHTVNCLTKA